MTSEKAIEKLTYARQNADEELDPDWCVSLDMAIKALENKGVLEKIRAEIEAIIGEHNLDDYDFCSGLICARKIIDKYKAESKLDGDPVDIDKAVEHYEGALEMLKGIDLEVDG